MKKHIFAKAADAGMPHAQFDVIAITLGESGYTPIYSKSTPEVLNDEGVTQTIIDSAIAGSMFGWTCPAAKAALEYALGVKVAVTPFKRGDRVRFQGCGDIGTVVGKASVDPDPRVWWVRWDTIGASMWTVETDMTHAPADPPVEPEPEPIDPLSDMTITGLPDIRGWCEDESHKKQVNDSCDRFYAMLHPVTDTTQDPKEDYYDREDAYEPSEAKSPLPKHDQTQKGASHE